MAPPTRGKGLLETIELLEDALNLSDGRSEALLRLEEAILIEGKALGKNERDQIVTAVLAMGGLADGVRKIAAQELIEGVRRGYSTTQLWEGYAAEKYRGVREAVSGWYERDTSRHDI